MVLVTLGRGASGGEIMLPVFPEAIGRRVFVTLVGLLAWAAASSAAPPEGGRSKMDFDREVRPILARHCFGCHGARRQEAGLRLDIRTRGGESGPLVVPGRPDQSRLVRRLTGRGGLERMPAEAKPLPAETVAVIVEWIRQGAIRPKGRPDTGIAHWAYRPVTRPAVPTPRSGPVHNPVDAFVLARLGRERLEPAPPASRETLIRRLSLDLLGIPPTPAEIDRFLGDPDDGGWERLVDRLLASPRYGERWAVPWLDAARFSDSNGYQRDGRRETWAFRDWVIEALNADMPFDRFTIEQLAGDLLPDASLASRIATGFHRGTMANVEAGTDPEEERVLAIIDRINTTGTVWLGSTIECAQCHDHKYDPFTQVDYYRLFAFFNGTEAEIKTYGSRREFEGPRTDLPLDPAVASRREKVTARRDAIAERFDELTERLVAGQPGWESRLAGKLGKSTWRVLEPLTFESTGGSALMKLDDSSLRVTGNFPGNDVYRVTVRPGLSSLTAIRLNVLADPQLPGGGPGRVAPGNFILSEFTVEQLAPAGDGRAAREIVFRRAIADFEQPKWPVAAAIDGKRKTGWGVAGQLGRGHHAVFIAERPVPLPDDAVLRVTLDQQYGNNRTIGRFQLLATDADPEAAGVPNWVAELLRQPADKRTTKQAQRLRAFYLDLSEQRAKLKQQRTRFEATLKKLVPATTLVMRERSEPRVTRRLIRGDFLDPAEPVTAGTPAVLPPLSTARSPNRLDLAKWLVDGSNPLVARVTVNRAWSRLYGHGLVETLEDFGTRGARPSHPELLDWLADEFVRGGWSLKRLHRLLVTSATYRQSSRVSPAALARDPRNRLFARAARFRLTAELIRDNALAVSGLLSDKMRGPPVFPYQPPGVWNHIGVTSNVWATSAGEDLYRRGVYVYWRRTVPYPSFVNFDGPSREACAVARSRSNTPLQALTLLNDPVFFEAAARLAGRLLAELPAGTTPAERVGLAFRLATARRPEPVETAVLVDRFRVERSRYAEDPEAARALVNRWAGEIAAGVDPVELAAWVHVANVILNLDEVITRE